MLGEGSKKVQEIIGLVNNFSMVNSKESSYVFTYLEDLSDFLKDQEQIFYNALGVKDIVELNNHITILMKQNNLSALDAGGSIYNYIASHYQFSDKNSTDNFGIEEDIFSLFTQLLAQEGIKASKFLDEYATARGITDWNIYDACMDALTQVFSNLVLDNGLIKYIFTARGQNSATGLYKKSKEVGKVTIKLNLNKAIHNAQLRIEDDMFIIEGNPAGFSEAVAKEIKQVIRPEINKRLNKDFQNKIPLSYFTKDALREEILNIIKSQGIQLTHEDIQAANSIEINSGKGGISGFLGELQGHLLARHLFPNGNAKIIDAGANLIKNAKGASQMDPADLIIKIANQIFNIQIKNYQSGGAKWGGGSTKIFGDEKIRDISSAESFLVDRLQVNGGNANILKQYFGAVTYNNLNPKYANSSSYDEYNNIYNSLITIFSKLKDSFDTFIPNIIRLTLIISGRNSQYDNFYYQKGRMIPSSAIIDGIIEGLYNNDNSKIFTSSYSMYPGESLYSPQHPYPDNYASYASNTLISWNISISFSRILAKLGL